MTMRKKLFAVIAVVVFLILGCLYLGYPIGKVIDAPETHAKQPNVAVILLSGDGGSRTGMAPAVTARLRKAGMPVVLINSLTFFSRRRSPPEISALLQKAMSVAESKYHATRFVMIGQSFGADALPTALGGLSPESREKVAGAILIVPSRTMLLRATPFELLNWGDKGINSLPAAQRLDWVKLACIRGVEETESLCPKLTNPGVIRKELPGGHYLRHNDERVFETIFPIINADFAAAPLEDSAEDNQPTAQH
ncbi:type IV secretion system protein VirJ [Altererythrobacter indicus]|uniref:Type IV secretion system protein VirJ n=1 Tax=Altericroceibacterium indicum TaxID=374177 RepID=A0A845A8H6_9SPHN|nr:AcvB/VirJ family lysyl-phosphatidylglycerol hydrolase [Altericroceibacterium indicum]MXP25125.1 type IV secretion system protein VirJ [Altericroceibacterium indicum]